MSLPVVVAFAGVLAAAVATGILAGRCVREPRACFIAWTVGTFGLTVALAAQAMGFGGGFGSATFRAVQLGAQLLAPLWLAWGLVEIAARDEAVSFAARLVGGALTLVGGVILATDSLTSQPFSKAWPAASVHYQSASHYALILVQVVAVAGGGIAVAVVAARARQEPEWRAALTGVGVIGIAMLLTVALRFSLPARSAYPLLSALAAGLVWFGISRDLSAVLGRGPRSIGGQVDGSRRGSRARRDGVRPEQARPDGVRRDEPQRDGAQRDGALRGGGLDGHAGPDGRGDAYRHGRQSGGYGPEGQRRPGPYGPGDAYAPPGGARRYGSEGYGREPGYGPEGYGPEPGYGPEGYGPEPGYAPEGYGAGYGPGGYGPEPGYAPEGYGPGGYRPGYGPEGYGPDGRYGPAGGRYEPDAWAGRAGAGSSGVRPGEWVGTGGAPGFAGPPGPGGSPGLAGSPGLNGSTGFVGSPRLDPLPGIAEPGMPYGVPISQHVPGSATAVNGMLAETQFGADAKAASSQAGTPARPYGRILIFTLLDDKAADFDQLAEQTAEEVRTGEPDTLVYVIHLVPNAPMQRIFYEIYRDRAAFDSHENKSYMQRFVAERRAYVLATNVIELRVKYAKVAPLPADPRPLSVTQAVRAQLPPGQGPAGQIPPGSTQTGSGLPGPPQTVLRPANVPAVQRPAPVGGQWPQPSGDPRYGRG